MLAGACSALVLGSGWPGVAAADEAVGAQPSRETGVGCLCEKDRAALLELRERVANAPTVASARELATGSARRARVALGRARFLAFMDRGTLDGAYNRLLDYESRVADAPTQQAVASEFDGLVLGFTPGATRAGVDVDVAGGCTYSTGEVIAVVLGLILGVIPGLILLVLLC